MIDRLVTALQAAVEDPTLKERFADLATDTVSKAQARPEALAALLKSETEKWGTIIKKAGVQPE